MDPLEDRIKKIFHELIQKFEGDPGKFLSLAGIYKALGDTDKALSILYNGLKNNRSSASAKIMIAEILYDRWMIDETKRYLEDIIDTTPNNEKVLNMLYSIYKSEENLDKALGILNLKLVFGDKREETINQIEIIKSNINQLPRISDISRNIRAKLHDQNRGTEDSSGDKLTPNENMADHYINQGDYGKAVEILEELIKKNPNDIHLRTRLSLCQASKMFGKNFVDNKKGI